jgi:hypothetical protein
MDAFLLGDTLGWNFCITDYTQVQNQQILPDGFAKWFVQFAFPLSVGHLLTPGQPLNHLPSL